MADFDFISEEANYLFEDMDCAGSVLDSESPIEGLFNDLNFDWDNDGVDLALGDTEANSEDQPSSLLTTPYHGDFGCATPEHVSCYDEPMAVTPTREHLEFPMDPNSNIRKDPIGSVSHPKARDHGASVVSKSPSPPPFVALKKETKKTKQAAKPKAPKKTGVSCVPDLVSSKCLPTTLPAENVVFHAGSSEPVLTTAQLEAKRRRAIRREILISQKKGKVPLVPGNISPLPLFSIEDDAEQLSAIASLLLQESAGTPFVAPPASPAPVTSQQVAKDVSVPKPSIRVEPQPTQTKRSSTTQKKPSNSKPRTATPSKKAKDLVDEESVTPDVPASMDVPEHLADLPAGTDPESRRQRRLIRNRLSAALHRKRKRETIDSQKKIIDEKDDEISRLQSELDKMSSKYYSLRSKYDRVVHHFGEGLIKEVVDGFTKDGKVGDAPPHLVNISGSDQSVASSDDDSSTPPSPRASPMHTPSSMEEDESSHEEVFASEGTQNVHGGVSVTSSNHNRLSKRKRAGVLPAMATMAMCAVMGCVMLPPSVFKALDPDGAGLNAANVIISSDAGADARRRLDESVSADEMSAMSKWSELGLAKLLNDPPKRSSNIPGGAAPSSFVISPIETRPNLWRIDSAGNAPWTSERSITLFDFRAILAKQAALNMKNSPVVPPMIHYRFATPLSREVPKTVSDKQALFRRSNLGNLRGTNKDQDEMSNQENMYVKPDSVVPEDEDTSLDILRDNSFVENTMKLGPNFMFCPSAYASVTPGFLQLAGLTQGETGDKEEAVAAWNWPKDVLDSAEVLDIPRTKEEAKAEMIVDFDDDENEDDATFEDAQEEPDKSLVPRYNYVDPSSSFPFHSRNENTVPLIKNVFTGSVPYMSILVPASTLSPDLSYLNSGNGANQSEPWVELGCQVVSAKLVDDVQFVGDSYSNLH